MKTRPLALMAGGRVNELPVVDNGSSRVASELAISSCHHR